MALTFIDRMRERLRWILVVSGRLGATVSAKVKMACLGFWYLVTDARKSEIGFSSKIAYGGNTAEFYFDDLGDYGLLYETFVEDPYRDIKGRKVQTIFDIGANSGVTALYFRLRFPEAEIYCFEPDPENVSQLQKNAAYLGSVSVYDCAVWSEDGEHLFYTDPHRGSSSSIEKVRSRQREITVRTRSLDSLLDEIGIDRIDILKFDIEGAEEEVFRDFRSFDKVELLLGEVHGDRCDADSLMQVIEQHFNRVEKTPMEIEDRFYLRASR